MVSSLASPIGVGLPVLSSSRAKKDNPGQHRGWDESGYNAGGIGDKAVPYVLAATGERVAEERVTAEKEGER